MFQNISSTLYQVGKAIRKELFTKIIGNIDDINSRTTLLESGANKVVVFDSTVKVRNNAQSLTGLNIWRAPATFTLLDARLVIFEKGTATGILEMDVKKSVDLDPLNFQSVFQVQPSIDFDDLGTQDFDQSNNTVFDINQSIVNAGEYLRLDITALPVPIGKFQVYLIGEIN
jgi:hypothetical protein